VRRSFAHSLILTRAHGIGIGTTHSYLVRFTAAGAPLLRALCAEASAAAILLTTAAIAPPPRLAGVCDWAAATHRLLVFTPSRPHADVAALRALSEGALEYIEADALLTVPAEIADVASTSSAQTTIPEASASSADALRVASADGGGNESANSVLLPQAAPPWHLDRLDAASLPLDNLYAPPGAACGAGVHLFMVDTGIASGHVEFTGRIRSGFNAVPDAASGAVNASDVADCHGHGTHTSGVAAGGTYGVAKCALIHPVRVFNCGGWGSTAALLAGLAWVAAAAAALAPAPCVVSMSVGGAASAAVNDAVNALAATGLTIVTSAGNAGADACAQSPASAPGALAVGATDDTDARTSFSSACTRICVCICASVRVRR
jgi:hypothetical protein